MTVREELIEVRNRLDGIFDRRERESVILLIFSYVKGWSRVDLIINEGAELSEFAKKEIDSIVDRLILGEPIQYITGQARFYGMDFNVGSGVLIPRPETEELVDWIVDDAKGKEDLSVLDIGTGSGCIAISLARALAFSNVTALDFSQDALKYAEANAKDLKAKISFLKADMYDWLPKPGSLDIVVSNPPYIHPDEAADMEVRVKDFEPHEALFVTADQPIRPYKRIEEIAGRGLKPGGSVYLELNPRYAEDVKAYYISHGWEDVEIRMDSYGKKRFLKGIRGNRK
ncbi:MAG: peptide chain release factor N(5)-glutamine methyltransferase [Muribaculaceae bacterium]|nr:peptide chain release factor N(5)-glutamine methyltransferase [Muribaculaceae bacterium]